MSIDEIYEDLIESIKDIDFTQVDSNSLKRDPVFISLTEKYKEIFNPGSRRTNSQKNILKKEIVNATKDLIRTKYTMVKDKTVHVSLSICRDKDELTPNQKIEETMGVDLNNHSDLTVLNKFSFSSSSENSMNDINIAEFAKSHILMFNGKATELKGSDVAYLINNIKGKIIFLADVSKESPFNRYDIPFINQQSSQYKIIKNSGFDYDMYMHNNAKTILFNSDGTPKISYIYTSGGYVFQWYGSVHFKDIEDMYSIDETLYSILTMLVVRMNYVDNEGGEADQDGNLIISGSPADSKIVTKTKQSSDRNFPSNISYSENGYTGVLNKKGSPTVISGSYQTSDKITVSTTITLSDIVSNDEDVFEEQIKYEKDGYKGFLKRTNIKWGERIEKRSNKLISQNDTKTIIAKNYEEASIKMLEQSPKYIDYSFQDPDTKKTIKTKLKLKCIDKIKEEQIYDQCNGFFYWMDNTKKSIKMTRKNPFYPKSYYGEKSGFTQKDAISAVWTGPTEGPGNYVSDKHVNNTYRRPVSLVYRKKAGYKFTFKIIWEGDIELPDYHTNVFKGEAIYSGEVTKDEIDDRIWQQLYEGTVSKPDDRIYGNAIDQTIEEIEDDPFTSYNVSKKLITMDSAKRHVVKINEIEAEKNKYKKNSYMQSINLITYLNSRIQNNLSSMSMINNITALGFYCNEYIPDHFPDKEKCIKYYININGNQYEILPVNSTRNGKKKIRNTEVQSDSEYVIYINESIKSAYLTIVFDLPNNDETPFISNLKILIS